MFVARGFLKILSADEVFIVRVIVKFSGLFFSLTGVSEETVDIAEGATVNDMIAVLSRKYKNLPLRDKKTYYFVNNRLYRRNQILKEKDQVSAFQLFAGG